MLVRMLAYLRAAWDTATPTPKIQLGFFAEEGWGPAVKNYADSSGLALCRGTWQATTPRKTLAICFKNGLGVQTDYAEAMSWFVEAAAHGNSNAENQLGWMYQFGQGVKPDDARAVTWYRMSADQGNRRGIDNLHAFEEVLYTAALDCGKLPILL